MGRFANPDLDTIVRSATALDGVVSAVIFVSGVDSGGLELAAAAGLDGLPLERLEEAVRSPSHPISRTLADSVSTFDVLPTAPGGPALRSHLPLVAEIDGGRRAIGVLAVAHEHALDQGTRTMLERAAAEAAALAVLKTPGS